MAFRDKTDTEFLPMFYNVTFSVGPGRDYNWQDDDGNWKHAHRGAINRRDDVMLVQYFLKRIYQFTPGLIAPEGIMTVDGFNGPITQRWIVAFQNDVKNAGLSILPD